MKSLRLERVTVVSLKEKKGRTIQFDQKLTILKGKNNSGKSSIIKSILHAFGAEPNRISKRWLASRPKILIEFRIDKSPWAILRNGGKFSLFFNRQLVGVYSKIVSELSPELNRILGSKIQIADREGEIRPAIPAVLFMPYYLDQETGWVNKWASFKDMQMYPDWKKLIFDYHIGILPDEWFELIGEDGELKKAKEKFAEKIGILNAAKEEIAPIEDRMSLSINDEVFKKDLQEILHLNESLASANFDHKQKMLKLRNERTIVISQIEILTKAKIELSKDLALSSTLDENIECPTCGVKHENNYSVRFSIADDEDRCKTLIEELEDQLARIENNILQIEEKSSAIRMKMARLTEILQIKKDNITMDELIRRTGQDVAIEKLNISIAKLAVQSESVSSRLKEIKSSLKEIDDKERRKQITNDYWINCNESIAELNLGKIDPNEIGDIRRKISENGAELPRAILAFQLSYFRTIQEVTGKTLPLIIDAPNQQEQDENNLKLIIQTINNRLPSNTQAIIGIVDDAGVQIDGKVVLLEDEYSVLLEEYYDDCKSRIESYALIS